MAKPTPAQCHTMISYYIHVYKEKYGREPVVNRHSARWGFDSVLQGLSLEETKALLDYYLITESDRKHPLDWFFYNYDKLVDSKRSVDDDDARRARLRRESQQRVEEWLARGNTRIASH